MGRAVHAAGQHPVVVLGDPLGEVPASTLPLLSSRELEVLQLLADGASNADISKTLYISRRTTEHHVEHILTKLDVTSRTAAVAYALTHELLP